MKKISFIILFLNFLTYGQDGFFINFRGETVLLNYKVDNTKSTHLTIPVIQNLYIPFGFHFDKQYSLEFRPGYMLSQDNYEGFEIGVFLFYNFYVSRFSINGGINFHFNEDTDGNEGFYGKTIFLIGIGLNYKLANKIFLEVSYQNSLKSNYGFYGSTELGRNIEYSMNSIVKLGIIFRIN